MTNYVQSFDHGPLTVMTNEQTFLQDCLASVSELLDNLEEMFL